MGRGDCKASRVLIDLTPELNYCFVVTYEGAHRCFQAGRGCTTG